MESTNSYMMQSVPDGNESTENTSTTISTEPATFPDPHVFRAHLTYTEGSEWSTRRQNEQAKPDDHVQSFTKTHHQEAILYGGHVSRNLAMTNIHHSNKPKKQKKKTNTTTEIVPMKYTKPAIEINVDETQSLKKRGSYSKPQKKSSPNGEITKSKNENLYTLETLVKAMEELGRTIKGRIGDMPPQSKEPEFISLKEDTEGKKDITYVFVRVEFHKIAKIDTLDESFTADVLVQCKWFDPDLDGRGKQVRYELKNWSKHWDPQLYIENAMDVKEYKWRTVTYDRNGRAVVTENRKLSGSFYEQMELQSFPVDTQHFTITVGSRRGKDKVEFEELLGKDKSFVSNCCLFGTQEWDLHKDYIGRDVNKMDRKLGDAQGDQHTSASDPKRRTNLAIRYKQSSISIACKATRRASFFMWNIMLVMLLIGLMSFAVFAVDVDKPQNRLQLSFILLLSIVAFKMTVNNTIPRVAYLTYLDHYILWSMIIMCMMASWHAIVYQLVDFENDSIAEAETADRYAILILGAIYLLFNIIFVIILFGVSVWKRFVKYKGLKDSEVDYDYEVEEENERNVYMYKSNAQKKTKHSRNKTKPHTGKVQRSENYFSNNAYYESDESGLVKIQPTNY